MKKYCILSSSVKYMGTISKYIIKKKTLHTFIQCKYMGTISKYIIKTFIAKIESTWPVLFILACCTSTREKEYPHILKLFLLFTWKVCFFPIEAADRWGHQFIGSASMSVLDSWPKTSTLLTVFLEAIHILQKVR